MDPNSMHEPLAKDQVFLNNLRGKILANLENENFGVKELVSMSGMSRSRLSRRLHASIHKTITQFIRETRLIMALEMLQNESMTASEVAYKTGFSSPSYFSTCFHKYFGFPPGKIKEMGMVKPEVHIQEIVSKEKGRNRFFGLTDFPYRLVTLILVLMMIPVSIVVIPNLFRNEKLPEMISSADPVSVAVMPFQNFTRDTTKNFWREMIQDNLITSLTNSGDLQIRQLETTKGILKSRGLKDYASITPSIARSISKKLEARIFIYGSINQAGNTIRLNAQLVNSKTEDILASFQVDGTSEHILFLVDTLSDLVENSLIISQLSKGTDLKHVSTSSAEAYKYYLLGMKATYDDYNAAVAEKWFLQAIALDSNFYEAVARLASVQGVDSKKWVLYNYKKRDGMPMRMKLYASWAYAFNFETINDEITYLKQLQELDEQDTRPTYLLALAYSRLHQYDKAVTELEKSMELYRKWGAVPSEQEVKWLGNAYHKTGQFKKERKLYKMAAREIPDRPWVIYRMAIFSLYEGDLVGANRYIEKLLSVCRSFSIPEWGLASLIAQIYYEGGFPDQSEEYHRKALELEPENKDLLKNLSLFLIDNNRNLDEGLKLADQALEIYPDNYSFLECKGWGLFKIGEYKKALELLEKSWELKDLYDYDLYLHLQEARKAIASSI